MNRKIDDLEGTTMRVTRRTTRTVEYLRGLLKFRTGRDYSLDDVIWEALNVAFGADIDYASQPVSDDKKDKTNS